MGTAQHARNHFESTRDSELVGPAGARCLVRGPGVAPLLKLVFVRPVDGGLLHVGAGKFLSTALQCAEGELGQQGTTHRTHANDGDCLPDEQGADDAWATCRSIEYIDRIFW